MSDPDLRSYTIKDGRVVCDMSAYRQYEQDRDDARFEARWCDDEPSVVDVRNIQEDA